MTTDVEAVFRVLIHHGNNFVEHFVRRSQQGGFAGLELHEFDGALQFGFVFSLDFRATFIAGRACFVGATVIAVGYAVYLAKRLKIDAELSPRIQDWYARLTARDAFKRADARR